MAFPQNASSIFQQNLPRGYYASDIGMAETSHKLTTGTLFIDACGPDSIQRLVSRMRIHEMRVCRLWFTIPDNAVLPLDNTLFILLKREGRNTALGTTDFLFSSSSLCYDHTVSPPVGTTVDPTQNNQLAIDQFMLAAVPITDVAANTPIVYENKCGTTHVFSGESNGITQLRIQVVDSSGAIFVGLNDTRIFIEAFVVYEPTV
jgi:hypothetical protein